MKTKASIPHRELALAGLFGAAGLTIPFLFHLLHLGSLFMPMYLPLVALGFFVSPTIAAITAFVVPLLSGLFTGMPPFFPPVAPVMSIELSIMAVLIAAIRGRFPHLNAWLLLAPVLIIGRLINFSLFYAIASAVDLPAAFVAGLSFISGWPGLLLMMFVIPPLTKIAKYRGFTTQKETP